MSELVEARRGERQPEHDEEQLGLVERLVGRRRETLVERDPQRREEERGDERQHDGRTEERCERCREPPRRLGVGDDVLQPQAEKRVRLRAAGVGPVGSPQQAERPQARLREEAHVLLGHVPARALAERVGERGMVALAVDLRQQAVEERGELDGLAVARGARARAPAGSPSRPARRAARRRRPGRAPLRCLRPPAGRAAALGDEDRPAGSFSRCAHRSAAALPATAGRPRSGRWSHAR